MIVWWGTRAECVSALARRGRDGTLTAAGEAQARVRLHRLDTAWAGVLPNDWLRATAEILTELHPLKTADAFQLAALITGSGGPATGAELVCLDGQLRNAALEQGFTVLP